MPKYFSTKNPALIFRPFAKFDKPAAICLFSSEQLKKESWPFAAKGELKQALGSFIQRRQFKAQDGEIVPLRLNDQWILLVGLGKKHALTPTGLRATVRKAMLSEFLKNVKDVELVPHEANEQAMRALIDGVVIGSYVWNRYQTKDKESVTLGQKTVFLAAKYDRTFDIFLKTAYGVNLARDLVNDNADVVTSDYLESVVRELIKGRKNIGLEILNKKDLQAKGLNLHLAVNQGSKNEPKLIMVKYTGQPKSRAYAAVIGKGITFDTGGLNLKPTGSIETMRSDMAGAAAVIGLLRNVLDLGMKKNIIFAVTIAENALGSRSCKPGDVVMSYEGKTVEIGNTDAEGRLVLADAIAYVRKNYRPAQLIDIATLTGACVVALGYDYSGLISTGPNMTRRLLEAAKTTDDRLWELPTYSELKHALKSQIADIRNIGLTKGAAGTLLGGEFLRQFTDKTPWAHLDIAGTAFTQDNERLYFSYGATGSGVRLLTSYFQDSLKS